MADITGTSGVDVLVGTTDDDVILGRGAPDVIKGSRGDDRVVGGGGDDVLYGGRGEDLIVGSKGTDVMFGGLDADTFRWNANHIGEGEVDFVADFDLRQGDSISFQGLGEGIVIKSVSKVKDDTFTEANGVDLRNKENSTDVFIVIENAETGEEQTIVLFDSWSSSKNDLWLDQLAALGLDGFGEYDEAPEDVIVIEEEDLGDILPGGDIVIDDLIAT